VDQDIENRLRTIEAKVEENHRLLVALRRHQRLVALARIGYWIVIILMGFLAVYLIKPYLGQLGEAYGLTHDEKTSQSSSIDSLLDELNKFQSNQ
jgi:hypothetical protein